MGGGLTPDAEGWARYELPAPGPVPAPALPVPADVSTILENQAWFCSLRWVAIGALGALAVLSALPLPLPWPAWFVPRPDWPGAAAAALLLENAAALVIIRRVRKSTDRGAAPARLAEAGLWLQVMLDLAVVTVVVHFVGSTATFAPYLSLFHIVLACIFFPHGKSFAVTAAAMGMYLACLAAEAAGLPSPSAGLTGAGLAGTGGAGLVVAAAWQWASVAFVATTVWFLASSLSRSLRRRDAELLAANARLEASMVERSEHLLRTTHQLKAPFAAIHASTQVLQAGLCGPLPPEAADMVGQVSARCESVSRTITSMVQLANLRSVSQDPPRAAIVDVAEIAHACAQALRPLAVRRHITLDERLAPAPALVAGDHARMIVENLLSNALAYSRDGGAVAISAGPGTGGGAVLEVADQGIGIDAAKLPLIFDEFYRTREAAAHNPASTGLGLAIVRHSANASGVGVAVASAPGRGTRFTVTFPAGEEK